MKFDPTTFEMFLFTSDPLLAKKCVDEGVEGIIIDWENKGKGERQNGYSTQINYDTPEDLEKMRKSICGKIICRINSFNEFTTSSEVELAISGGADEILLPMVERKEHVEYLLSIINERCKLGILIETAGGIKIAGQLESFPLSRVYIGLNDLQISRRSSNLFQPLTDGTVDYIKSIFPEIPLGTGGLTHPASGFPVPASLLIKQYAELNINFSFLRRSFLKDVPVYGLKEMISGIRRSLQHASRKYEPVNIN